MPQDTLTELAEAVRQACVETAAHAYEQASISGLCGSGAWEVALGAVKSLDVVAIVERIGREGRPGEQ